MRTLKTRLFCRWARTQELSDSALATAVAEMETGLIDDRLGGNVVKKRVRLPGRGQRSGARALVAFKKGDRAIFVVGFAKNERANISALELKALKLLAEHLLELSPSKLAKAAEAGELIEIELDNDG
ncbi:MAG TPA: type II toxin-antitoxin system RelE/ParE family toxin [Gammaproteobacteria bacterium]